MALSLRVDPPLAWPAIMACPGTRDPGSRAPRGGGAPPHTASTARLKTYGSMSRRNGETGTPARLELELQRDGASEEERAADGAQRLPPGEDHQRHRDEARGPPSSTRPRSGRSRARATAPAMPPSTPGDDERLVLEPVRTAPGRERGRRGSRRPRAARAPTASSKAPTRAARPAGTARVDQRVVREQRGAEHGHVGRARGPAARAALRSGCPRNGTPTSALRARRRRTSGPGPLASWLARRPTTRYAKSMLNASPAGGRRGEHAERRRCRCAR